MAREYRIVSADTHILEPPDIWQQFLPSQYLEHAPRLVKDAAGGDAWQYAHGDPDPIGLVTAPGKPYDQMAWLGATYEEARPGCYSGKDRLADMDYDAIDAEIVFPPQRTISHWISMEDVDLSLAGIDAYNRFLEESFCAPDPSRLIGAYQIPGIDLETNVRYLRQAIERGFKTVVISTWPSGRGEVSADDDEFWAVAAEAGIPVCIHFDVQSRSSRMRAREGAARRLATSGTETPKDKSRAVAGLGAAALGYGMYLSKLAFTGVFERFPGLHVCGVEVGCGWVPYLLEQMDDRYWRNRSWSDVKLSRLPSEYWYDNMSVTFIIDRYGVANWASVGVDNAMWSTDYPHHGCDWPYSRRVIEEQFAGIPRDVRDAWVAGNATRIFHLGE